MGLSRRRVPSRIGAAYVDALGEPAHAHAICEEYVDDGGPVTLWRARGDEIRGRALGEP